MNNENYLQTEIELVEDNLTNIENYLVYKGQDEKLEAVQAIKDLLAAMRN